MTDVKLDTYIISIIEIQGIKFSSRNFQIEIELKQVMILNTNPIFNNCLIKTTKYENKPSLEKQIEQKEINSEEVNLEIVTENKLNNFDTLDIVNDEINNYSQPDSKSNDSINKIKHDFKNDVTNDVLNDNVSLELEIEDLDDKIDENIKEVDIDVNLEHNLETFTLKKPNQVYFDLYKEARNKAKLAKKQAIIAYLEAKNIKKTYMIDNLDDSESEFDAEIDEVSESELEGL
jgi:hypothetical protein